MFLRNVDVYFSKPDGTTLHVVRSSEFPNTYICEGSFTRTEAYSSTDSCVLSVYNLSPAIRGTIALGGYNLITICYGYKDDTTEYRNEEINSANILFRGTMRRMQYTRNDAATSVTQFYILDCGVFTGESFMSGSFADGVNLYEIMEDIKRRNRDNNWGLEHIILSDTLKDYQLKGNRAYFGPVDDVMTTIAQENGFVYERCNSGIALMSLDEVINKTEVEAIDFTDNTSGIIGIPELTDDGVFINCLTTNKLHIHSLIKIDNYKLSTTQNIQEYSAQPGATIDPDGLYVVININGTFTNSGNECSMKLKTIARSWFAKLNSSGATA